MKEQLIILDGGMGTDLQHSGLKPGENPAVYDPKVLGKAGMARVTELVKGRIRVCGCDGKSVK